MKGKILLSLHIIFIPLLLVLAAGSMENGKMTMKPVEGDKFKVVLEFEKSGPLEVEAEVRQE